MDLNLVLVEPEIPQNTGNIARTCAAVGAALHIVRPMGFAIDSAKLKRAGLDYWDKLDITYYDSLEEFMEKTKEKRNITSPPKPPDASPRFPIPTVSFLCSARKPEDFPRSFCTTIKTGAFVCRCEIICAV